MGVSLGGNSTGGGGDSSISNAVPSPVAAALHSSGALADHQVKCEIALCEWLLTHTPSIHPDTSLMYAKYFYTAKMTTIERLAKKIDKESGYLMSLGVEEEDADDIVQAMQKAQMLTTKP